MILIGLRLQEGFNVRNRAIRISYCALLCALLIISTQLFRLTIPGTDVMVTLQVFFVLLCGQLVSPRYCLYTLGLYLAAGLLGLPVFSSISGPAVLTTPSAGYLVGFMPAACACSLIRKKNPERRYWASLGGILVLYLIAVTYLVVLSKIYTNNIKSFFLLLIQYCLIFLPLDVLKGIAAAWMGKRLSLIPSQRHLNA